MALNLYDVKHL